MPSIGTLATSSLGTVAVGIAVTDTSLEVTFTGLDRLWALSTGVSIPLDQIVSARTVNRVGAVARLRWRLAGAYWPGLVCAGHFSLHSRAGRALACVYRAPTVLEVTTRLWRPHLVLLQHADAEAVAVRLSAVVAAATVAHGDSTDDVR